MCKGTTNWEDVYIIDIDKIPEETLKQLNRGWIGNHGGIPVDKCIGEEIESLIADGVVTVGSCCGHGTDKAHALALKSEINKLINLGYSPVNYRENEGFDLLIFELKR
jgi:hypothetical protein